MKIGKKIMIVFLISISSIAVLMVISYINHSFKLKKEEALFKPIGEIVEVNGSNMSIYTEGSGKETLVFMSGGGTSSPILDFKSLYSELSDKYKIVVIEKKGYGFSDVVDTKRDIDTILSESREALSKLNINGPYILCPHSMSGLEAIYWAEKYPDEVKAIVGLDIAVPEAYENYKINNALLNALSYASKIGITRLIPNASQSDAVKYGTLTETEKEIYKAVFFRRTATKTMLNEVAEVKSNALKVKENSNLNIPMLMYSSNGVGTGWSEEEWKKLQSDYASKNPKAQLINLDCTHYVHDHEYKRIAEDINKFIDEIE